MNAIKNISLSRRAFLFGGRYSNDQTGATSIEYGMIAALVGLPLLSVARKMGKSNKDPFGLSDAQSALNGSAKENDEPTPGGVAKTGETDKVATHNTERRKSTTQDCKSSTPSLRSRTSPQPNSGCKN